VCLDSGSGTASDALATGSPRELPKPLLYDVALRPQEHGRLSTSAICGRLSRRDDGRLGSHNHHCARHRLDQRCRPRWALHGNAARPRARVGFRRRHGAGARQRRAAGQLYLGKRRGHRDRRLHRQPAGTGATIERPWTGGGHSARGHRTRPVAHAPRARGRARTGRGARAAGAGGPPGPMPQSSRR
jgi:hypothetical protein